MLSWLRPNLTPVCLDLNRRCSDRSSYQQINHNNLTSSPVLSRGPGVTAARLGAAGRSQGLAFNPLTPCGILCPLSKSRLRSAISSSCWKHFSFAWFNISSNVFVCKEHSSHFLTQTFFKQTNVITVTLSHHNLQRHNPGWEQNQVRFDGITFNCMTKTECQPQQFYISYWPTSDNTANKLNSGKVIIQSFVLRLSPSTITIHSSPMNVFN